VNCWFVPSAIVGDCGLMAMETSAAGVTVSVVELVTEPELMPIVVVPVPKVVTSPFVPDELLIVATVGALELQ
jgi:hypothetical protein